MHRFASCAYNRKNNTFIYILPKPKNIVTIVLQSIYIDFTHFPIFKVAGYEPFVKNAIKPYYFLLLTCSNDVFLLKHIRDNKMTLFNQIEATRHIYETISQIIDLYLQE